VGGETGPVSGEDADGIGRTDTVGVGRADADDPADEWLDVAQPNSAATRNRTGTQANRRRRLALR
jgi:hypothetical protein